MASIYVRKILSIQVCLIESTPAGAYLLNQ
jgi:hypothetical protein